MSLVRFAALGAACAAATFVPPWQYDGFDRFPALWFGANSSGLDNSSQLNLVARHSLAGYGWQQGVNRTDYRHGETSLAQAAVHLADYVAGHPPHSNATPTKVFVYRHFQMSWAVFDITRAANANVANDAMFLRSNDDTGVRCGQVDPAHNTSSPLLVYLPANESGAAAFWVGEVVAEVALESGVDAVFFDETDWSYCGYSLATRAGCPNISTAFLIADYRAKLPALAGTAAALNAAGVWPIFSTKNYLNSSYAGLTPGLKPTCVIPLDEYAAALAGVGWVRFEEFWLSNGDKDYSALQIDTALQLAARGVPLVAHSPVPPGNCSSASRSRFAGRTLRGLAAARAGGNGPIDLTYALAGFLIVQSPYSYFGVSDAATPYEQYWYDSDYCWHAEYDAAYGAPLGPAERGSTYVWRRSFSGCDVVIDVEGGTSEITFHPVFSRGVALAV